jgi:hypothetical protein
MVLIGIGQCGTLSPLTVAGVASVEKRRSRLAPFNTAAKREAPPFNQ